MARLRLEGGLKVHAGRLVTMHPSADGVHVEWRPRGANETLELRVDRVINCTGPDYDARRTRDPLWRSLLVRGAAIADPFGLSRHAERLARRVGTRVA